MTNIPDNKKAAPRVLVTGASGMLGAYVVAEFADHNVSTLGRSGGNTFRCDLTKEIPDFGNRAFDVVVHCAGTEDDRLASLNSDGTANLLKGLDATPPRQFVFISSFRVYGKEGENITEEALPAPVGEAACAKEKAEREVKRWAKENGVILTVVRPARMFGTNVGGETLRIFNDALSGFLIHIRGNDARISLATALDVARGIRKVYTCGGVYNAADGVDPRFIDMAEAMTANAGREKRLLTLPAPWAGWAWRLGRWIPAIDRNLNPAVVADRYKTLTINGDAFAAAAGLKYYDTIEVIARRDGHYPYAEK